MMSKHAQLSNAPASLRPVFYTDDHTGKTYTIHPRSPSDYHHRAQSYGKENYQAGHPQRGFSQTQMPQQNNSMLKQPFMYNPTGYNVSHSDPHAARVGGHVPQSHLMPRNAALNPIAQRYTVPVVSYQGGPSQQDRQAAGATERATVYRPTPNFEPIHSFHSRPTDRVSYSADPRNGEIDPYPSPNLTRSVSRVDHRSTTPLHVSRSFGTALSIMNEFHPSHGSSAAAAMQTRNLTRTQGARASIDSGRNSTYDQNSGLFDDDSSTVRGSIGTITPNSARIRSTRRSVDHRIDSRQMISTNNTHEESAVLQRQHRVSREGRGGRTRKPMDGDYAHFDSWIDQPEEGSDIRHHANSVNAVEHVGSRSRAESFNEYAAVSVPDHLIHPIDLIKLSDPGPQLEETSVCYPDCFICGLMHLDVMEVRLPRSQNLPWLEAALLNASLYYHPRECINWLLSQAHNPDVVVYISRYLIRAVSCWSPEAVILEFFTKLVEDIHSFLSAINRLGDFCEDLVVESGHTLRKIFSLDVPPGTTNTRHNYLFGIGWRQAYFFGGLFSLDFMPISYFMAHLSFLLEGAPHVTRVDAIRNMIVAAGPKLCHPHNVRDLGDFIVKLRRKYVLPAPGGRFPDVLFAKEEDKQDVFERVRSAMKTIESRIHMWRVKSL